MADSVAGSWATIEGQEIVNDARTLAYLKSGLAPGSMTLYGACGCPEDILRPLVGCDDDPYTDPVTDLAPWYDPAFPESADFAGFLVTKFEGMESTYTRDVFDVITGGGILGRLRAKPRTLTWTGLLLGRSCCGVAYGLRWLTSSLRQASCQADCLGEQLDLLVCCPCEIPEDTDSSFRNLYNVGLIEGPLIKNERKTSSGGCTISGCSQSVIMEIEFSLVAGNPHLYRTPITLVECQTWTGGGGEPFEKTVGGVCATPSVATDLFIKVPPGVCPAPAECPEIVPCATDPACPKPTLPVVTSVTNSCICDPWYPVSEVVNIPQETWGFNFQGAPIFQIYSGSSPLHYTNIRMLENPLDGDCSTVTEDPCLFCDEITIRYIPAFATLTIDGISKRITIECAGGVAEPGEQFLIGNYSWPTFECTGFCVVLTVDSATAASDACYTVAVAPKEM